MDDKKWLCEIMAPPELHESIEQFFSALSYKIRHADGWQAGYEYGYKKAMARMRGKNVQPEGRKGVFIPDITVEMLRNASLEGVEDLMASGEMEDISLPSCAFCDTEVEAVVTVQPRWSPCSEGMPKKSGPYFVTNYEHGERVTGINIYSIDCGGWLHDLDEPVAWMPMPEPYGGESE